MMSLSNCYNVMIFSGRGGKVEIVTLCSLCASE